jgi:hypothetical protein
MSNAIESGAEQAFEPDGGGLCGLKNGNGVIQIQTENRWFSWSLDDEMCRLYNEKIKKGIL